MTKKDIFLILQMGCTVCATKIEKLIQEQKGVIAANVDYATATLNVEYDPAVITPELFRKVVTNAGYDLLIE